MSKKILNQEQEITKRESRLSIADALWSSRAEAGKSQEYMAFELGIARKTVQNWEKGVSEPTIDQFFQWFIALKMSPLPKLFQHIYPSLKGIKGSDSDERVRIALKSLLETLPPEGIRQLMYIFYGDHGSSPRAILNLVTAHLQTPMKDRVTQAAVVLKNYEIAEKKGKLTGEDHIQPNVDLLKRAIEQGEEAAVSDAGAYVLEEKKRI